MPDEDLHLADHARSQAHTPAVTRRREQRERRSGALRCSARRFHFSAFRIAAAVSFRAMRYGTHISPVPLKVLAKT
jgi:hypothetical protein